MGYKRIMLFMGLGVILLIPRAAVSQSRKEVPAKASEEKVTTVTKPDQEFQKAAITTAMATSARGWRDKAGSILNRAGYGTGCIASDPGHVRSIVKRRTVDRRPQSDSSANLRQVPSVFLLVDPLPVESRRQTLAARLQHLADAFGRYALLQQEADLLLQPAVVDLGRRRLDGTDVRLLVVRAPPVRSGRPGRVPGPRHAPVRPAPPRGASTRFAYATSPDTRLSAAVPSSRCRVGQGRR